MCVLYDVNVTVFIWLYLRDDGNPDNNLWIGLVVVISFFLVISVLAFPNGEEVPDVSCVNITC